MKRCVPHMVEGEKGTGKTEVPHAHKKPLQVRDYHSNANQAHYWYMY